MSKTGISGRAFDEKKQNQGAVSRWVGPRLTEIPTTDPVEQKHDQ